MCTLYSVHQYYLIHPYSIYVQSCGCEHRTVYTSIIWFIPTVCMYNLVDVYTVQCTPVLSDSSLQLYVQAYGCVTVQCTPVLYDSSLIVYNVQPCGFVHCTVYTNIIWFIPIAYVQGTTLWECTSVHQYHLMHPYIVYNLQQCVCVHCTVYTSIIGFIPIVCTMYNLVDVCTIQCTPVLSNSSLCSLCTGKILVGMYKCTPVLSDSSQYCVQCTTLWMYALYSVHQYYPNHLYIVYNKQLCGCEHCTPNYYLIHFYSICNVLVQPCWSVHFTVYTSIIWFIPKLCTMGCTTTYTCYIFYMLGNYLHT